MSAANSLRGRDPTNWRNPLKVIGATATARALKSRGWTRITDADPTSPATLYATDPAPGGARRSIFVRVFGFLPDREFGGVTGLDESDLCTVRETHGAKTIAFVDYVLGAVYWASYEQMRRAPDRADFPLPAGGFVSLPIERTKHAHPLDRRGSERQLLWPVFWFRHVLGNFEALTDLEVIALRKARRPKSRTGMQRIGREEAECLELARYERAWLARRTQATLF